MELQGGRLFSDVFLLWAHEAGHSMHTWFRSEASKLPGFTDIPIFFLCGGRFDLQ